MSGAEAVCTLSQRTQVNKFVVEWCAEICFDLSRLDPASQALHRTALGLPAPPAPPPPPSPAPMSAAASQHTPAAQRTLRQDLHYVRSRIHRASDDDYG